LAGTSNIPVLKPHTNILSEPREKVEALSNQYTSVFTKQPTGNLPNIEGKPETPMLDFEFPLLSRKDST
jgi:hypothetical protein